MQFQTFIKGSDTYATYTHPVSAPILRKRFTLTETPQTASLQICVSGLYELYLNGSRLTRGFLCPYFSNPDHVLYYDTYDIAPYLQEGDNAVAVILGNGFSNQDTPRQDFNQSSFRAAPVLALCLQASGAHTTVSLETDETWKMHPSPILYDMYRFGVIYDARNEIDGFSDPTFDDSTWAYALPAAAPKGVIRPSTVLPVTAQYELTPHSIELQKDLYYFYDNDGNPFPQAHVDSGWCYDFGFSCAGVCRLKIKGKRGQQITLRHGEYPRYGKFNMNSIMTIKPNDEAYFHLFQTDTYILKGGAEEIFVPTFTYHGFRYVLVEGITEEQATDDLLTFIVFNTDIQKHSDFRCSDETLNTLYDMAIRADVSNFHHFPTDSPHREKNGWTGDISMSSHQYLLSFDCSDNFRVWLENVRFAQTEAGQIPGVVPTAGWGYAWGSGPVWDSAIVNIPYETYRFTGRTDLIAENADMLIRYLHYIADKRDERGLIACGLGDWCQPGKRNPHFDAPLAFTDSTQIYRSAQRSAFLFDLIGRETEKQYALTLADEMRAAIRTHLIDPNTCTAAGDCQTSQAVALHLGLFTPDEYSKAYQKLISIIHRDNDTLNCGMIGLRYLFHVLFAGGDSDLALVMMTKKDAPSYGNMIELGGTALFESLIPNGIQESQNHHFYGDIIHLFIEKLAGLRPNPQMDDIYCVEIAPIVPDSISHAQASYTIGDDTVSVRWEKTAAGLRIITQTAAIFHGVIRYGGQVYPLCSGEQKLIFA